MLTQLPVVVRLILLAILGAAVGAVINWAIYQLAVFRKRQISPWQPGDDFSPTLTDRIPIIGWLGLRGKLAEQNRGAWTRPLLIELVWAAGLPCFWHWQSAGGLTAGAIPPAAWIETWFWVHSVLIALLCIATFIDFDEKTIPDGVTVTGVLFALVIAALAPSYRLPVVVSSLAGTVVESLQFNSPHPLPAWHYGAIGLTACLAIFSTWIVALLPKLVPCDGPIISRWRFTLASILRPNRKTNSKYGNKKRRPRPLTLILFGIWIAGMIVIPVAWSQFSPLQKDSFFGAMAGLAFGGGLVWGIRIVAGLALAQEAMGFGDVTLMAMIGAFLGWQSTLLAFALAPFAGVLIAIAIFVARKESELAFGPYLCLGAVLNIFFWPTIWQYGEQNLFGVGGLMIGGVLLGGAVAMYPLLLLVRGFKDWILPMDEEH